MENDFVNWIYARRGKFDWIHAELSVPIEELEKAMPRLKAEAKDNKGIVRVQILKSKKDDDKIYAKYNTYKPQETPEVKAIEQMPDRESDDDLPF